ncbi:OmpA family protein [Chitinophaga caseinilytica]|uniref:OmpA family protein n=1 Tax=Chitinophaga caseinilytica TaxID=2267521 RepID=A0ABZ2YXB2_9BACT
MKKFVFIALLHMPLAVFSQSAILDKIKQKAEARAERRVDGAIDKSMDKAEEEVDGQLKQPAKKQKSEKEKPAQTVPQDAGKPNTGLKSYSKFDFIPGERIVYTEDFAGDAIGELPLKWTTNNRGETVTIDKLPGNWMRLFPASRFTSPAAGKLPENFTLEADLVLQFGDEGGYVYPELELKLLGLAPGEQSPRNYVVNQDAAHEVALVIAAAGAGKPLSVSLKSYAKGTEYFSNQAKELKISSDNDGKPLHISVWVQKERIRYWINGEKVFDIPQAVPPTSSFNRVGLSLESSLYTEDQLGMFISNIKVAEGTPDLRSKLITEGKLVTNGILFDVNSDRIRPESAGVLKGIAAVLQENATVRVKITGHTDSDGDAAQNTDLSKRRAKAVQAALQTEYGIAAARMETDGLGESKPVADNNTKEGKASNRRVEFIKL